MIKAEQIYQATNDGLDIIFALYPDAKNCFAKYCTDGNVKKHFAIRNEKTPSCSIKKYDTCWKVTDFGGEGVAESPIDLYMKEKNISRFPDAILRLAAEFNVSDELKKDVNKPTFAERDATIDEKDGTRIFELNEKFTPTELSVLGPNVKQEHVDALNWHSAKWIGYVKDRKVKIKYSNEHYPIFMRECLVSPASGDKPEVKFFKIYEPLNYQKQWRFSYTPEGIKPKSYINGLAELKAAYHDFNRREEAEYNKTNTDESKPYKEKKLPEAFVCSGERDSLCCRSLGYHPLWFNSETYKLSEEEYKEIMKYVEVLYNIPDIDETGIAKGTELALRFIDIHTIWLPSWLRTYHDNRGKGRKDLRDWMELRNTRKDFRNLMTLAMPARFWVSKLNKKANTWDHYIDTACLYNFLRLNGFYTLHDDNSTITKYVRITGNIVKLITTRDIREFCRQWVIDRAEKRDILNLVLNTPKLSSAALDSLQEITLDFTSYTNHSQLFFFPRVSVEVSKDGLTEYQREGSSLKNYVWQENVINHNFKKLDDMFTISRTIDEDGRPKFDIEIKSVKSHFFGYLINASRTYWRKELEYAFEDKSIDEKEAYHKAHLFDIAGVGLADTEIQEQKQNLINKIFTFGYMLHHYKAPSRAWAPMAMDNKIGENNECNGRSGKSFFFKTLSLLMKTVKLSGRNPKLMDNPHVFDQVTQHTQMLLLDDCDRYLNTGLFYDNITSDMTVNPKNNQSFTIPFEDSPKIAFTTNYVPADFDPSSEARLLYMVFSDYYHQRTEENDYQETRSIRDDFDEDLFSKTYTEDEWNADINFFLQCCRFYLSLANEPIKIMPPMDNIIKRKFKADMGVNFEDWAATYFSEESERLDKFIVRERAFNDFKQFSGINKATTQSFTKKLKAFVELCPYIKELNPEDLCNSQHRIIRRDPANPDGSPVEMIYLRSKKSDVKKEETQASQGDIQPTIPFNMTDAGGCTDPF